MAGTVEIITDFDLETMLACQQPIAFGQLETVIGWYLLQSLSLLVILKPVLQRYYISRVKVYMINTKSILS